MKKALNVPAIQEALYIIKPSPNSKCGPLKEI